MKSISNILLIICLLTAFSTNVFAEFPNISKAIEARLYKGKPEDITSFGKKQQARIEQLLAEAQNLLGQTVSQSEKEEIEDEDLQLFEELIEANLEFYFRFELQI